MITSVFSSHLSSNHLGPGHDLKLPTPSDVSTASSLQTICLFFLQYKTDLKSDEEIFEAKTRELQELEARVESLEQQNAELQSELENAEQTIRGLEEQIVGKQMELDNAMMQLKTANADADTVG